MSKPNSKRPKPVILSRLFAIDARSLALFRIIIGTVVLLDLAIRAADLRAMYTDEGMFSRAEICRLASSVWNWSFHFGGGSWEFQAFLFGIAAVFAIALTLGFETRWAAIGCWLMQVSIQHRAPAILSGAEILLRMLLFWAMFLPLARAWSLDARRKKQASATEPILSIASAAILLQMALMYLFSAIYKTNPVWMRGDALFGILQHDFFASPVSAQLLKWPGLLGAATVGTLVLEWMGPVLLFSPAWTSRLRLVVISLLVVMHLSIDLLLRVGMFSYVSIAGLALFLPPEFWNAKWLKKLSHRAETQPPIPQKSSALTCLGQGICAAAFVYVLLVNFSGLPGHPLGPVRADRWKPATTGLGLGQNWGMFGSIPSKDGWYVARATLKDGSEVDLLRGGTSVDWSRPREPAGMFPNHYWHKLFREMAYDDEQGFQLLRKPVSEYLCRDWNAKHSAEKQVVDFELAFCSSNRKVASALDAQRERLIHLDFTGP